ncbi:hypothetical protein BKG91_01365 [Rodentibacter caecimuris]|uniref:LysM domain-containing protein n=1 Tax=Rodentibacter caecimuris TaxID=1796644 RepID=A0AAJ3K274_9PAST|nr:murein hydrolase activator NlpD [Rodentibacter heylii]AOF53213.1 Lipoprotein NlpD [Pasteurellaceae bacterium NI1060]OOF70478.1 hypothetical protein BKG90_10035 [Rodentibacter heylii]OOF76145.1 hypothetical protein BKG99_06880 [Rodentibacter heylii]OOF76153.1 hypothetical protein BKG91_01365 [Rodentibacter heylii]QIA77246.1 murein hydrolase activator NlpD [Rodentibacter heylii]
MKKSFLLLPLSVAILTACSSNTQAPIENAGGTLSPGIMQPVDNNGGGTWQPEIQQNTMPNHMGTHATGNMPVGTQTPQPNFQPTYQPVQPAQPVAPVQPQTKTVTKTVSDCTGSAMVNVPRNPNTNAPDYSQIQKGSYKGETYKVNKGDTMFLIAYLAGMDVKELAAMNNMSEPYSLSVGQTLKIGKCVTKTVTTTVPVNTNAAPVKQVEPAVTYRAGANGTQIGSDGTIIGPVKSSAGVPSSAPTYPTSTAPVATGNTTPVNANVVAPIASNTRWMWPANGNIIQGFSSSDGGNKGIDISGSRGQSVKAAAAGRVVYAGNALRGYGNLIIIKHDDDFLSAYAHNDRILVSDQQEIRAGQEIAKMGSTGTNSVKLHFEIRYKGKSVDPIRYLPRR